MLKDTVKKLYEAMNARDDGAASALLSADFTEHDPKTPGGKEGFFARCADFYGDEEIKLEIIEIFEDKEGCVCAYVKAKKDGVTVFRVADIFRVEDGLITEQWSMRQKAV